LFGAREGPVGKEYNPECWRSEKGAWIEDWERSRCD